MIPQGKIQHHCHCPTECSCCWSSSLQRDVLANYAFVRFLFQTKTNRNRRHAGTPVYMHAWESVKLCLCLRRCVWGRHNLNFLCRHFEIALWLLKPSLRLPATELYLSTHACGMCVLVLLISRGLSLQNFPVVYKLPHLDVSMPGSTAQKKMSMPGTSSGLGGSRGVARCQAVKLLQQLKKKGKKKAHLSNLQPYHS